MFQPLLFFAEKGQHASSAWIVGVFAAVFFILLVIVVAVCVRKKKGTRFFSAVCTLCKASLPLTEFPTPVLFPSPSIQKEKKA